MKDVSLFGSTTGNFYGDLNDITIASDKDFNIVQLKSRARQNTVKILLTHLGSHRIFTGYGSELPNLLSKNMNEVYQTLIRETIVYCLTYLKNIEESNEAIEKLDTIVNMEIKLSDTDPRVAIVTVTIRLVNGDYLDIILEGV